MNFLDTPLHLRLPARSTKKFEQAGYHTIGDVLLTAPRRYYHWGRLTPMNALQSGSDVTILAQVVSQKLIANRNRGGVRLEVVLTDGHTQMTATFFGANEYKLMPHRRLLREGEQFLFAGKVGAYRGQLQLTHPEFEGAQGETEDIQRSSERPIPIYPGGKGITSWLFARTVKLLLSECNEETLQDPIPENIRRSKDIAPLHQVIHHLHCPETDEEYRLAKESLAWREAYLLQLLLLCTKTAARDGLAPASVPEDSDLLQEVRNSLPFTLTASQVEAFAQISADLATHTPSQRLLQADVGAGKTVVAALALAQVVGAGHQGAFLAPTGVLAEQHAATLTALMQAQNVTIHLLTASTASAKRQRILTDIETGVPCIVVGTHALLQQSVHFADLALAVIDEQHRFGVAQRDRLRESSASGVPHQLVMTATPIPRTIAMTVFGDIDTTRMTGLPAGRKPVQTFIVDAANAPHMGRLWVRAQEEVAAGGRVYVVCPRIDESEVIEDADSTQLSFHNIFDFDDEASVMEQPTTSSVPALATVVGTAQRLRGLPQLEGTKIVTVTGRDDIDAKAKAFTLFSSGQAPIMVATTVIEVGVDVSEATMMVILDAQQFGLSQLHQLRGRVGRSSKPALCMAVHRSGISSMSMQRLSAFAATTDGFELSEVDVQLRREGDVLGADQSGRTSGLRFLSVLSHQKIIEDARQAAETTVSESEDLALYPLTRAALIEQYGDHASWLQRS